MKATLLCNSIIISPTPVPTTFPSRVSQSPNFSPLIIKHNRFSTRSLLTETVEGETIEEPTTNSVSRRLILLRHAESSWEDRTLRDHERPLSKAGRVDAISVSHKLQQLGWIPELILSSDAARTRETLKIMQEQVRGFVEAEIHFFSSFYSIAAMDGQTAEHIQQAVCGYSRDEILTVILSPLTFPMFTYAKGEHVGNWIIPSSNHVEVDPASLENPDPKITIVLSWHEPEDKECMGHNRGWEEAASMFSGALVELKTCNAALLEATGKSWNEAFSLAGLGGWKLHGIVKPNGTS